MRQRGHFHSQESRQRGTFTLKAARVHAARHFQAARVHAARHFQAARVSQREFHSASCTQREFHSASSRSATLSLFPGSASFTARVARSASFTHREFTQRGHSCTRESRTLCTAAPQFNSHSHRRDQKRAPTPKAAPRQYLGMSAASGSAGLHARSGLFEFAGVCVRVCVESGGPRVPAVLRSCGPAGVICAVMPSAIPSAMHAARPGTTSVNRASRCVSRCANFSQPHALTRPRARWRWWRWVFSLALVARWRRVGEVVTIWRAWSVTHCWLCPRGPVAVRRRALGAMPSGALGAMLEVLLARCLRCSWRGAPVLPELVALGVALGAAWRAWRGARVGARGAWRGACRLLGGPKKRRRSDTEDGDTCGRPAAGSATRRHVLVRLHTRLVRVCPSHSTNHTDLRT